MRRILLVLVASAFISGCALQQPYTEIGAIGYKNVGFEKTIHISGRAIDTNADGKFDQYILESADVVNDATKTFEAQLEAKRLDNEMIFGLVDRAMQVINTWLAHQAATATAPAAQSANQPPWWAAEILARLDALKANEPK